jgi:flagellar biosynthetic protein FliP
MTMRSKAPALALEQEKRRSPKKLLLKGLVCFCCVFSLVALVGTQLASAASFQVDLGGGGGDINGMDTLQLLFLFALLSLGPTLLLMMTSFTRIIIVFSFLRNALGLQQTPPNQVMVGLALFLSLFIMSPVLKEVNTQGLEPYTAGTINEEQALEAMQKPIKKFMIQQIKAPDLNLFLTISGEGEAIEGELDVDQLMELGMEVIVPSFITSELKRAFSIGFMLFLPFLIIDMIVASTLMSMGMVMLPPTTISLPFKLMLFVVLDGWGLVMDMLVRGFNFY